MKRSRWFIPALVLAGVPNESTARQVELLEFPDHTQAVAGPPGPVGPGEPALPDPVMSSLLRQVSPAAVVLSGNAQSAPDPANVRMVQPVRQLPMAPSGGALASPLCVPGTYTPTWWNPPETERRRAIYYTAVKQIACESGLPPRLLDALIAQESGYNPYAVSRAGAAGMMQIMPATARSLGLANPYSPIANLRAGAKYLRQQFDRFGRYDLALAAYNAGPERRALQNGAIPAIPETRNYVRTIIANWGRLIRLEQGSIMTASDRGGRPARTIQVSGYRELELIRYD